MSEKWTICPHKEPWEDIGIRIVGEDGKVSNFVCALHGSGEKLGRDDEWVKAQNKRARLIIAAPDLLEALNHAEAILSRSQQISTNCNGLGPSTTTTKALKMVRAAIAATEVKS